MLVVVLVGADGQSSALIRSSIQYLEGGIDLSSGRHVRGLGLAYQGMPFVAQDMADSAQPAGLALDFLVKPSIGIGFAFVSTRAPGFALEVGRPIRRLVVIVFTTIAARRCPGIDQGAIHAEMLLGQQAALTGLIDDGVTADRSPRRR